MTNVGVLIYCYHLFDSHGDTSIKKFLSIMSSTPVFWAIGVAYQHCIHRRVPSRPTAPSNAIQLKGSKFWLPSILIISFAPVLKVCVIISVASYVTVWKWRFVVFWILHTHLWYIFSQMNCITHSKNYC